MLCLTEKQNQEERRGWYKNICESTTYAASAAGTLTSIRARTIDRYIAVISQSQAVTLVD